MSLCLQRINPQFAQLNFNSPDIPVQQNVKIMMDFFQLQCFKTKVNIKRNTLKKLSPQYQ